MRQVIPFTKNIEFKTMINEITNISLEHNLALKDEYNINGDLLISGKYKINATSPAEEDFSYKIPVDITIDSQYKTDNIELEIDDFKYEKADGNKLKVDVSLSIDNLEKKEESIKGNDFLEAREETEIETLDFDERKLLSDAEKQEIDLLINSDDTPDLFKETSLTEELLPTPKKQEKLTEKAELKEVEKLAGNVEKEIPKTSVGSLFTAFKDTEETFSTYSVYILRNGDNIEDIIAKYKTTREALEEYNDLSKIKIGSKIIIPSTRDEDDK